MTIAMVKIFERVLVIADDLTGANDSIAQFSKMGFSAITATNLEYEELSKLFEEYEAIAVDTESRKITPREAYDSLYALGCSIKNLGEEVLLYKKIDSTLRGNVLPEIKALYESLNPEFIAVAPAFPKQGRVTVNGIQKVHGVPVDKTLYGSSATNPAKFSDIAGALASEFGDIHLHIGLDQLRSHDLFAKSKDEKVFSFDAETDDDLNRIVESMEDLGRILWVGSAGLAEAIARNIIFGGRKGKPVLMAVGSINDLTRRQTKAFIEAFGAKLILPNLYSLVKEFGLEADKLHREISEAFESGFDVVLSTSYLEEQIREGRALARKLGVSQSMLSLEIADKFGKFVCGIIQSLGFEEIGGLLATGGDVAISIIKNLGISRLRVIGEIEPGIPLLEIQGMKFVSKAGGFGDEQTFIRAAARLKSKRRIVEK